MISLTPQKSISRILTIDQILLLLFCGKTRFSGKSHVMDFTTKLRFYYTLHNERNDIKLSYI